MDLTAFEDDRKTYDAVERCLERISEAAAKLGDMALHLMPDQPWQKIRAFGNILRHEYDKIREDKLFEIVKSDLPGLYASSSDSPIQRIPLIVQAKKGLHRHIHLLAARLERHWLIGWLNPLIQALLAG